jgi:hypothetical protein
MMPRSARRAFAGAGGTVFDQVANTPIAKNNWAGAAEKYRSGARKNR